MSGSISSFFGSPITQGVLSSLLAAFVIGFIFDLFNRSLRVISVSYRISMLGLPRSGKTALVAAMFSEIFSDPRKDLNPVGPETIGRVNQFIEILDSGRSIPPTREKDVFIFRFIYYIRRLLISKIRYEGEVVDFPGEMSKKLLDSAGDGSLRDDVGLFGKEFYSWIISSRAVIFVIDCGAFLSAEDRGVFAARMTSEIRAAWQLLQDEGSHSFRPGSKRVALVFSKVDAARFYFPGKNMSAETAQAIAKSLFDRPFKRSEEVAADSLGDRLKDFQRYVEDTFSDLIGYLGAREAQFQVHFVSAYFKRQGRRIGIEGLLNFVLPRRTLSELDRSLSAN